MNEILVAAAAQPDQLQVRESPDPTVGKGAVRIGVEASGIDFADILARQGLYRTHGKIPCVVGYEFRSWMTGG